MLTDQELQSDICHEKYSNSDFHLFDKSGREDAEISKKREAKSDEKDQETFHQFLIESVEQKVQKSDFTELKDFVKQSQKFGRGPSKIRRIAKTKKKDNLFKVEDSPA